MIAAITVIIFAATGGSFYYLLHKVNTLRRELHELEAKMVRVAELDARVHENGKRSAGQELGGIPQAIKITSPPNLSLHLDRPAFTIAGEAPDGSVLILSRDSSAIHSTITQNRKFIFRDVRALAGENEFLLRAIKPTGELTGSTRLHVTYNRSVPALLTRSLDRGDRSRMQIALTFDGGAEDNAAQPILDILRQNHIKATMFLTGTFIQSFPATTRAIIEDGHEVGNHTWDHPHLTTFAVNGVQQQKATVSRELVQEQLQRTARLFEQTTGQKMAPYWRAPFGEHNQTIRAWAAELGYRHIGWTTAGSWRENLDTTDWVADTTTNAYHTSEEILQKILHVADEEGGRGAAGGIILMHLGTQREDDLVYQILPALIQALQSRNYEFVTISQMLASPAN